MKPLNKLTMQSFMNLLDELGDRGYEFVREDDYEYSYNGMMYDFTSHLRPIGKYPNTFNVNKDYIALLLMEYETEIKHWNVTEYALTPIKSIEQLIRIIDPDTRFDNMYYNSDYSDTDIDSYW